MNQSFKLESLDKLTVGAVGEPGNRLFLLQAQHGSEVVTLKVEKEQIRALSLFLAEVLQDLARPGHIPEGDELALTHPADPAWVVGPISVNYDEATDRLLVVCEQATFSEEVADLDAPAATAEFHATREQIAALAIQGTSLVEAGRPPCPLCGFPINPEGHACPRTNGNSQPTL